MTNFINDLHQIIFNKPDGFDQRIWFTSDPHLGDERQELLGRPFRDATHCAETINSLWNEKIAKDDFVVVIGDWCLNEAWLHDWTPKFNGRKFLLKGNYDRLPDETYLEYFEGVNDYLFFDDCRPLKYRDGEKNACLNGFADSFCCVHYPTRASAEKFNLVGHIHAAWRVQKNMLNVGLDAHHYRPLSLSQVYFFVNAIHGFYDEDVWAADHSANRTPTAIMRGKPGNYYDNQFSGTAFQAT